MSLVGIIANPSAGRDIRRLVAHASVFDNNEKVNIVRRVLLGLDAVGVEQVLIMPEAFGIGRKALDNLHLRLAVHVVEMDARYEENDSTVAAGLMAAAGAQVLVTLGGDGTNRAVAKSCGDVPLTPISTGTNNAFPVMVEGTLAGLAAGLVALGIVPPALATQRSKRIEIWRDERLEDIALVDAVVYQERFLGARAVWNVDEIREVVLAHADPCNIGLSSIGGFLLPEPLAPAEGLLVEVGAAGEGAREVLAPVAPGVIRPIPVKSHRRLAAGDTVVVDRCPAVLALDGERKLVLQAGRPLAFRISLDGPRVVDIPAVLRQAAQLGWFIHESASAP